MRIKAPISYGSLDFFIRQGWRRFSRRADEFNCIYKQDTSTMESLFIQLDIGGPKSISIIHYHSNHEGFLAIEGAIAEFRLTQCG